MNRRNEPNLLYLTASISMAQCSIIVGRGWGGLFLPIVKAGELSFLRFAAIEVVEGEKDLGDLAPQRVLIAAEPVERVSRQIGEA